MSASALLQCDFAAWHAKYGALAPASSVVPLPDAFVAYLAEDGLVVGDASDAVPRRDARQQTRGAAVIVDDDDYAPEFSSSSSEDADGDGGSGGGSGDGEAAPAPWPERFPELKARIDAEIARLGGAVAPKLNWSAPTDALWVAGGSGLRCTSAEQAVLLVKASDRAAYDLEIIERLRARHAAATAGSTAAAAAGSTAAGAGAAAAAAAAADPPPPAPALVLRAWRDLRPEREFRCFVHGHAPVGICQRDPTQRFPQLQDAAERDAIRDAVCDFHARRFGRGFDRGACERALSIFSLRFAFALFCGAPCCFFGGVASR